jgi:hypothetical protein
VLSEARASPLLRLLPLQTPAPLTVTSRAQNSAGTQAAVAPSFPLRT